MNEQRLKGKCVTNDLGAVGHNNKKEISRALVPKVFMKLNSGKKILLIIVVRNYISEVIFHYFCAVPLAISRVSLKHSKV